MAKHLVVNSLSGLLRDSTVSASDKAMDVCPRWVRSCASVSALPCPSASAGSTRKHDQRIGRRVRAAHAW